MSIETPQYHTIVESRVHLTWYQSYALNLVMSIEFSNVEQRTPKEKGVEPRLRGGILYSRGDVGCWMKVSHQLTESRVYLIILKSFNFILKF